MMQQVEESGHSNWLPGHWTAPTRLSADNRVQDSTNPVRKGHSQVTLHVVTMGTAGPAAGGLTTGPRT